MEHRRTHGCKKYRYKSHIWLSCPTEDSFLPKFRIRPPHMRRQPFTPSKSLVFQIMWHSQLPKSQNATLMSHGFAALSLPKATFSSLSEIGDRFIFLPTSKTWWEFTHASVWAFQKYIFADIMSYGTTRIHMSQKPNYVCVCLSAHPSSLAHYSSRPDIKIHPSPCFLLSIIYFFAEVY